MKRKAKRNLVRVLALLMAVMMTVTYIPLTGFTVHAEEDEGSALTTETEVASEEEADVEAADSEEVSEDGEMKESSEILGGGYEEEDPVTSEEAEEEQEDEEEEVRIEEAPLRMNPGAGDQDAVLFGFNKENIENEESFIDAANGSTNSFNPWEYAGDSNILTRGSFKGYIFVWGYDDKIEWNGSEEGDIPFYFAIEASKVSGSNSDDIKLEKGEGDWIKSFDTIEALNSSNSVPYVDDNNTTINYKYYKTTMHVKGVLRDKEDQNNDPLQSQTVTIKINSTEINSFTFMETGAIPKYSVYDNAKSEWGEWITYDYRSVNLPAGTKFRVDFDVPYDGHKQTSGIIGEVGQIDDDFLNVTGPSADIINSFKSQYNSDYPNEGTYYIFTLDNNKTYYPEFTVKSTLGMSQIYIGAVDEEGQYLYGSFFQYNNLPVYTLRQVKSDGTYGDILKQRDNNNYDATRNDLEAPGADKILTFVLCDESGTPLNGGDYSIAPYDDPQNDTPWYGANGEVRWEAGGYDLAGEIRDNAKFSIQKVGTQTRLSLKLSSIDQFPFPDLAWFDIELNFGIVDTNNYMWTFEHSLRHEPVENDPAAFGLDWYYDKNDPNWKRYLADRTNDRNADYDNNLFLSYGLGETTVIYVRIPTPANGSESAVVAKVAMGNTWIKQNAETSLPVIYLADYAYENYDSTGQIVESIDPSYSYYRVDLPLNNDDNVAHVAKFSVKNLLNGKDEWITYSIYDAIPQYRIHDSNGYGDWQNADQNTVTVKTSESIQFRMTGSVVDVPDVWLDVILGAVRVEKEREEGDDDDDLWLLGYERDSNDEFTIERNKNTIFAMPDISDNDAKKKLEDELGRVYGQGGDFYIFNYPKTNNSGDTWNPELTVTGEGINRVAVNFINRWGCHVSGNSVDVANHDELFFIPDGKDLTDSKNRIKNWKGEEHPYDDDDRTEIVETAEGYQLKFWPVDGDGKKIPYEADYNIRKDAWLRIFYRGRGYDRENNQNEKNIKVVNENGNLCLIVDLSFLESGIYDWLQEEGNANIKDVNIFDPLEWYTLSLNFRLQKGNNYWDNEFELRHDEKEMDYMLFGLGDWDENDDAGYWQDRIANNNCGRSSWSRIIAGDQYQVGQEEIPVFIRMPKDSISSTDQISVKSVQHNGSQWGEENRDFIDVTQLGTAKVDGKDYDYYRVLIDNHDWWMHAGNEAKIVIDLGNSEIVNFYIQGIVFQYQINDGDWMDYGYDQRIIPVEAGDRIRFNFEGSLTWGHALLGAVSDIQGKAFDIVQYDEDILSYINDDFGRNDCGHYNENEEKYYDFFGFYGVYDPVTDESEKYYPEIIVKDGYVGTSRVNVQGFEMFHDCISGNDITFSTLPQLTLRQADANGDFVDQKLIPRDASDYDENGNGVHKNHFRIPSDNIFRFYLCDENGEKLVPTAGSVYEGCDFESMDPCDGGDTISEAEMKIFPHFWGGDECQLHYTWEQDINGYYYLKIDLSGNERTTPQIGGEDRWNNNFLLSAEDGDVWLPGGFDMGLTFILTDTGSAHEEDEWKWAFNVWSTNHVEFRQDGNLGDGYSNEGDERFNLSTEGPNALLPTQDGKVRLYLYDVADSEFLWDEWREKSDYRNVEKTVFTNLPRVSLDGDWVDEDWVGRGLFLDDSCMTLAEDERGAYLEIDLSNPKYVDKDGHSITPKLTIEGGSEVDAVLDLAKSGYGMDILFCSKGGRPERNYSMEYSPVTLLGWNSEMILEQELNKCLTGSFDAGISYPGWTGYLAPQYYRKDGSVDVYVRVPKNVTLTKEDIVLDGWFEKLIYIKEADISDAAECKDYPVSSDAYHYYHLRIKGDGGMYSMDDGMIEVTADGVKYPFYFAAVTIKSRKAGETGWDVHQSWRALLEKDTTREIGFDTTAKAYSGGEEKEKGVIGYVRDLSWWDEETELTLGFSSAAETAWYDNYAGLYGPLFNKYYNGKDDGNGNNIPDFNNEITNIPEDWAGTDEWVGGCQKCEYEGGEMWVRWGFYESQDHSYPIFTDATGTVTYYPQIKSPDDDNDYRKDIEVGFVWDNGELNDLNDFWYSCANTINMTFETGIYTLRYEKDLENDFTDSESILAVTPESKATDSLKFYVYRNGERMTVDNDQVVALVGSYPEMFVDYDGYGIKWDSTNASAGKDNKGVYLELKAAPLLEMMADTGHDFSKMEYSFELTGDIGVGKIDKDQFVPEYVVSPYSSRQYYPADKAGARVITGTKTGYDGKKHEAFTVVEDKGSIILDHSLGKFSVNVLNLDMRYLDLDKAKPVTITSSKPEIVECTKELKYENELKFKGANLTSADFEIKKVGTSVITYSIYLVGKEDPVTVSFTVNVRYSTPKDIASKTIECTTDLAESYAYTGEAITATTITLRDSLRDGAEALVKDVDYTVLYENNTNVGTATLTITGKGDYTGTIVKTYKIYGTLTYAFPESVKTTPDGREFKVPDAVTFDEKGLATLAAAPAVVENYKFAWYSDAECTKEVTNVAAGTSANPTYYGKWTLDIKYYDVTFETNGGSTIAKQSIQEGKPVAQPTAPTKEKYVFAGWFADKELTVKYDFASPITADIVIYAKWTEEGGIITDDDTVTPADKDESLFDKEERKSLSDVSATIGKIKAKVYDGNPYLPTAKVTAIVDGKKTSLIEGVDYRVLYKNNIKAGTGKVIVKGNGIYDGEITADLVITKKAAKKLKVVAGGMALNSTEAVPIYVYDGGKRLTEGVDYTLTGTDGIASSVGKKTVTITAKPDSNYDGSLTAKVEVYAADKKVLKDSDITLDAVSMDYTGKALKPAVTVKYNGEPLDKSCYSVKYVNNKDAGTAYVVVTGKKDYAGSVVKTFTIKTVAKTFTLKKDIKAATYNGKYQKPKAVVTVDGKTLKAGKDYVLIYGNNLHAGTAQVIVKGLGNYKGTADKSFDFKINAQNAKKISIKGTSAKDITYLKRALKPGKDYTMTVGEASNGKAEVTLKGAGDFTGEVKKKVKAQ